MIDVEMLEKWIDSIGPSISVTFPVEDGRELIRLAQLGVWALDHAIPALRSIEGAKKFTRLADCCVDKTCHLNSETGTCSFQTGVNYGNCDRAGEAEEALAALPKEKP